MAEEWDSLHSKFAARISKHRGGSSSHSPSPFLKSKSFTLSTTSSHGSASSLPRGRDLDPADCRDRPGSDSSMSHSGGPTPQPPPCPPSNYVNIDTLSGKSAAVLSGEEEDREVVKSNVGGYETPAISVKKEKDEEQEEGDEKEAEKEYRKEGPHPSYANWQFLSLSNPTKPTSVCIQKKPVPLQRKLPSGTDPGLAPPLSSVPKKPLTPPKPKMLQLSTKPTPLLSPTSQTSSIKPVNESMSMWMPANPAHPPSTHNTKPSATPNSSSTDGAKTKGGKLVQPPPEIKPRSYTTSTLDKKQPLLPPVKGSTVSTLFSSKLLQLVPKEQSCDTPLSPVQEMEADTSQFEASSDPSPTDTTKLLAKGRAATTAASSNPSTSRDGLAATSAKPTSSGGREELMRKLSIRRQKLEQQIQVTVNKADSPPSQSTITAAAAERTSEYSHDSSSSTQSELVLAYRRTDESPSSSTGNVDGSVVLRKPDNEKEGNLAKYGIIEDVNGGSFVI